MFDFENILCYRAFTELYIDIDNKHHKPCCQFNTSTKYNGLEDFNKTIRNDNLKNNWSAGCENCQTAEENKNLSHRLFPNHLPDQSLIENNKFILKHLELRLDTVCNLACVTCDSGSSSKWSSEDERMYGKTVSKNNHLDYNWVLDRKLWENVESLNLYGGEPFYSKKLKTILSWLIANDFSQNIKISFYTNGTIFNEQIIEMLNKFKCSVISISIDGVGQNFEIIRWPAKWSNILDNIERLKKIKNSEISITYTVSILNIFNIKNDMIILKNITENIAFNLLERPEYYNIQNIPEKFKVKLIKDLGLDSTFAGIIKKLKINGNNKVLKECIDRLKTLDKFRNTYSDSLFPENFINFLLDNTP